MSLTFGDLLWERYEIQEYIYNFTKQSPHYKKLHAEYKQADHALWASLSKKQRKLYLAFESSYNVCTSCEIQGAFYAGLGLRLPLLDALGVSDTSADGTQPEPGSQPRS